MHPVSFPYFREGSIVLLLLLQCLLLRWGLVDIGRAVFRALLADAGIEDHRSDVDTADGNGMEKEPGKISGTLTRNHKKEK